jgi:hypothetical protein
MPVKLTPKGAGPASKVPGNAGVELFAPERHDHGMAK